MRLLFVHQNFPGQYRHLAAHYAAAGHEVVCVGEKANLLRQPRIAGAKLLGYELPSRARPGAFEGSVLRAIHRGRAVAPGAARSGRPASGPMSSSPTSAGARRCS